MGLRFGFAGIVGVGLILTSIRETREGIVRHFPLVSDQAEPRYGGYTSPYIHGENRFYNLIALETLEVATSSAIDSGTLMAANVMRPQNTLFGRAFMWTWTDGYGDTYQFNYEANSLFALRTLFSALVGAMLYIWLTRLLLRLAQIAVVRRGLLPP